MRLEALSAVSYRPFNVISTLRLWAKEADDLAVQSTKVAAAAASKRWWAWVDEQLRAGAGALHAYTKRDEKCCSAPPLISGPGGQTVSVQAMLESDRETWRKIWERFMDDAQAPWREPCAFHWAAELPTLKGTHIAKAATRSERQQGSAVTR